MALDADVLRVPPGCNYNAPQKVPDPRNWSINDFFACLLHEIGESVNIHRGSDPLLH